jgi:ABC-type cobalamin transport system ATPase subunit
VLDIQQSSSPLLSSQNLLDLGSHLSVLRTALEAVAALLSEGDDRVERSREVRDISNGRLERCRLAVVAVNANSV